MRKAPSRSDYDHISPDKPTYLDNFNNLLTATEDEDEDGMEDGEYDRALCAATILTMAEVG